MMLSYQGQRALKTRNNLRSFYDPKTVFFDPGNFLWFKVMKFKPNHIITALSYSLIILMLINKKYRECN